ncbi:MAG: DUF1254 domain-containing protein [Colwellia sp.]|nr:DUF1254 domain-containing protein [Colwellia sp.]MCW8863893.1 DUF1254 domain-containing protein [Colwellia sp.]MCW9081175.1 DUF1254 domain-containing protein [Colwellia sp.]
MKIISRQSIGLWILLFSLSWLFATGGLLYKLPNLIINKISNIQLEQVGKIDTWLHKRSTVDHTFTDVVRPNVDAVYSSVFADLTKGPYVLEAPVINKYWSFGFYANNTTNFKILSIRNHEEGKPVKVMLAPKGYEGDTQGMEVIEAPSDLVWIIARLRIEGKPDEERIHAIQDQFSFLPLSQYQMTH